MMLTDSRFRAASLGAIAVAATLAACNPRVTGRPAAVEDAPDGLNVFGCSEPKCGAKTPYASAKPSSPHHSHPLDVTCPPIRGADPWPCPTGTGGMIGATFYELDASGQLANDAGVMMFGAWLPKGEPIELSVRGDRLFGIGWNGKYFDRDLVGAEIGLTMGGKVYYVRVASVGTVASYVGGDDLRTYDLKVRRADDDISNESALCSGINNDAVLFTGERYRSDLTVEVYKETTWFNIGCPHTPAYHMHLLRHTSAASDADHRTTWQQRQAMYKMLKGDFCGSGHSYTDGWQARLAADANGWFPRGFLDLQLVPNLQVASVEAIWTEQGAICVDEGRIDGIASVVRKDCGLPRCADVLKNPYPEELAGWQKLGHVLSANPTP